MLIKFKKIKNNLPIIFLAIAFLALVFFGLNQINRALAVQISGSWLQTTDSSTASDGFNFPGSGSPPGPTKTQTGVRGTGTGAGVGLGYNNDAISISGDSYHACAVLTSGSIQCWGRNIRGQLGNNSTTDSSIPVSVSGLAGAVSVSTDGGHSCAVLADGTAKCWGMNSTGQLGNNSTTDSSIPVSVSGLTGAVSITQGRAYTCALLNDDTAKCWGYNFNGQLGDGTTIQRLTPVSVSSLTGAVAIATGSQHSCALINNGTVKCWGVNTYGQLGDGTTDNSSVPIPVSGLTGTVISISAGFYHTCAVLTDGTAKCWGYNQYYQLGDGTTNNSVSPVSVNSLVNASKIAAGLYHTCALLNDSTIKCWGNDGAGQLGNDSAILNSSNPVAVSGISNAATISAGGENNCALLNDGTAKCWGYNGYGQLGDSSTTNRPTPVSVSNFSNGFVNYLSGTYASAIYDTAQNSTFTNLTFSSTVPANYNQWIQDTDADFGGGTNSNTAISGSGNGGSVKLFSNVDFGNSSDGTCSITSINTNTKSTYNCLGDVTIGTIAVTGSNPLVIRATGNVTISGVLNANGLSTSVSTGANGIAGGANGGGGSSNGNNGLGLGFGGGGGGGSNGGGGAGFGGIGGKGGNAGSNGGISYGTWGDAGSGGGGGGGNGGGGGGGGGSVTIQSLGDINIGSGGSITVNGGNSTNSNCSGSWAGGGGGSGGSVVLKAMGSVVNDGAVQARGGNGSCAGRGGGGGGGGGRIFAQDVDGSIPGSSWDVSPGTVGTGNVAGVPGNPGATSTVGNISAYSSSGTYASAVKQLPTPHTLGTMSWVQCGGVACPAGTGITMWVRTCTQADCSDRGATVINPSAGNWSQAIVNGASIASMGFTNDTDEYIQYKTEMTSNGTATPSLDSVSININYSPMKIEVQSSSDGSNWTSFDGANTWQTAYSAPTSGAVSQTNTSVSISTLPANQWVRYRVSLATLSNSDSPMMGEIRIGYISYTNFNFSVTIGPSEGEVSSGGSIAVDQPGITAANTFGTAPNPVAFSADPTNLPKGVSVEFSPITPSDPCTPGSCVVVPTFHTNVSSCTDSPTLFCPTSFGTTPVDTFVIPIRASIVADADGNILTKETTFTLKVTEPFNYDMTWTNTAPCSGGTSCSDSIKQGESISADLSALQISIGPTESISYPPVTTGVPGVSVLFSPGNCYPSPSCSATATIRTTFTGGAGDTPVTSGSPHIITITGATAGGLQRSITFYLAVTEGFNFSLSWDESLVTTTKSGSINSGDPTILNATLYTKYVSGSADSVSFSIAPHDPDIIINPSSIPSHSFTAIGETYPVPIEISAPSISVTQQTTYIITITGLSNGGVQKSANYSLTIYPPFDFDLKFTPDTGNFNPAANPQDASSGTVYQGDSLTANFIVSYNSQVNRAVNLSATASPASSGVSASLSKSSCAAYDSCLLVMLSVNAQSPAEGNFTVTITGDAGSGVTHTASYALTVVIPPLNYNVAGWAWSDGVGWISFNSQNCDTNWNGQIDDDDFTDGGANPHPVAPAACQPMDSADNPITLPVSTPNYGVYLDLSTYELSGYAWSEHIGWITLEKSIAGPPPKAPYDGAETYMAKMNMNAGTLEGWGRAVSCGNYTNYNPTTGTYDAWNDTGECDDDKQWGWIKLSGTSSDDSIYNVSKAGANEFSGFAWGDKALGWISFSSKNCDDNGLLASASSAGFINCGGDGATPFPAHNSTTHPDEYHVWFKGQLPNTPPSCEDMTVSFDDICGAPFKPKISCTYQDRDGDPLVQYKIKIYDASDNSLLDTIPFDAQPDMMNPGKYMPYEDEDGNSINSGSIIRYSYNGNTALNYAGQYYFTITVQDEYHLE